MSLIKQTIIDKVEIVGDFKTIQVREKISVLEDGNEISSSLTIILYLICQKIFNLMRKAYGQKIFTL
jgi:hypothetical protein